MKELQLHIGITPEEIFQKVDSDNSGKIDFDEFVKFFEELTSAKEFEKIFQEYSKNKEFINADELMKFLKDVQGEDFTFCEVLELMIDNNSDINSQAAKALKEKIQQYKRII